MSAPKFTPGPWEFLPNLDDSLKAEPIVDEFGMSIIPDTSFVEKADCYLMAASPAMYEALEFARQMLDAANVLPSRYHFIDEVLAKARNE